MKTAELQYGMTVGTGIAQINSPGNGLPCVLVLQDILCHHCRTCLVVKMLFCLLYMDRKRDYLTWSGSIAILSICQRLMVSVVCLPCPFHHIVATISSETRIIVVHEDNGTSRLTTVRKDKSVLSRFAATMNDSPAVHQSCFSERQRCYIDY